MRKFNEVRREMVAKGVKVFVGAMNQVLNIDAAVEELFAAVEANPFGKRFTKRFEFEIDSKLAKLPQELAKSIIEKMLSEHELEVSKSGARLAYTVKNDKEKEGIIVINLTLVVEFEEVTLEMVEKLKPVKVIEEDIFETYLKDFQELAEK